jgi:D-amino-acid dehydrogenase
MLTESRAPVVVIGAGIVGMALARALQREGRPVVVLDPGGPGRGTSFGNAGYVAVDHLLPLARPDVLRRIPAMLADRRGPLTVHLPSLPWLLPWMLRFAAAAMSPEEVRKGVAVFAAMMSEAPLAWQIEIQASGLGDLFRSRGAVTIFETEAGFRRAAGELALQKSHGTLYDILDGDAARRLVPGLAPHVVRGVHYSQGLHPVDPYAVVRTMAERFAAEGGSVVTQPATGFRFHEGRAVAVLTPGGAVPCSGVVVAAGRASGDVTRHLGFRAPLVAERGYHLMIGSEGVAFDLPVAPAERGFFITPMREGVRLAGTVELGAPSRPETWSRAEILLAHFRELFPGLRGEERSRWMGERPSLPDFRPAIGRAPYHDNVWCAYGHQHVGLTLATVTARLLVRAMAGEPLPPALSACAPGRFG